MRAIVIRGGDVRSRLLRLIADESVDLVVTDPPYESLQIHCARGTTTRLTTNWFSTVANERLPELLAVHPDATLNPSIAAPPSRAART